MRIYREVEKMALWKKKKKPVDAAPHTDEAKSTASGQLRQGKASGAAKHPEPQAGDVKTPATSEKLYAKTPEKSRMFKRLTEELKSAEPNARAHAAWALGQLGDARAIEPLQRVLHDKNPEVRSDAADALSKLGCNPLPKKTK